MNGDKTRILFRALEIAGDREQLARLLGVRRMQVDSWLSGFGELPDDFFLKAVDICLNHEAPSLWAEQPPTDVPPKAPH